MDPSNMREVRGDYGFPELVPINHSQSRMFGGYYCPYTPLLTNNYIPFPGIWSRPDRKDCDSLCYGDGVLFTLDEYWAKYDDSGNLKPNRINDRFMIDPINMTRYGQTTVELEETLLFACCVAGKNAVTTAKALDKFLKKGHQIVYVEKNPEFRPFDMLRQLFDIIGPDGVAFMLKNSGIGCYNHRAATFLQTINQGLDLKTCTPADLEKIGGIAEKTSRFFLLHTRPNVRYAALDTHIRKHMTSLGIEFPKGQPKGKRYLALEQAFLKLADDSGMSVAEFDLMLWNQHSGHKAKKEAA